MEYRLDSKAGKKLSILGFGCMRLPQSLGSIDMKQSERMIMQAIDAGVNYFDTAYIYPGSEEALGTILQKNNARDKVNIATKLPLVLCRGAADFDKCFNKELERLKTDHIDYYLMHMITSMAQWQSLCEWGIEDWIARKKQSGQVRQIGFSFHGMRDDFLKVLDAYDWEFCQIQYNYMNVNYQAGVAGLKRAAEKGLPVIIMEPLLGGKLANRLPPAAAEVFRKAKPDLSPAAWALRWLWNQPEVTVVLSGMGADEQVRENIDTAAGAVAGMLTPTEEDAFRKVTGIFASADKIPCTGCGYCMPCPKNVNIPECFTAYNTSYSMGRFAGIQQYTSSTGVTSKVRSTASQCVECGKCEKYCPQGLEIRKNLKLVEHRLEPFWYKWGTSAARAVLGQGGK